MAGIAQDLSHTYYVEYQQLNIFKKASYGGLFVVRWK